VELGVLVSSPIYFNGTQTTGKGKCFLQQFPELLGSNVAFQPDDRGCEWSSGASDLRLRAEANASIR